jgi:hypothetical protein
VKEILRVVLWRINKKLIYIFLRIFGLYNVSEAVSAFTPDERSKSSFRNVAPFEHFSEYGKWIKVDCYTSVMVDIHYVMFNIHDVSVLASTPDARVSLHCYVIYFLAYFPWFGKKLKVGLWDLHAVCVCVYHPPMNFWVAEPVFTKLGM